MFSKDLNIEYFKSLYPNSYEYSHRMGQCGNCVHIRRTPKYVRPVRYYCLLASEEMLNREDREFTDNDIMFIPKTKIPCNSGFEPNKYWKTKVNKIFQN